MNLKDQRPSIKVAQPHLQANVYAADSDEAFILQSTKCPEAVQVMLLMI